MTEGVAVHEVGHAADRLAEDDGRRDEVGEGPGVDVMAARVPVAGDRSEYQAALNRHAALPDEGDFQQVVVIIGPIEEEDVPKAAADDAGQTAAEGEIEYVDVPAPAVPLRDVVGCNAGRDDAEHK